MTNMKESIDSGKGLSRNTAAKSLQPGLELAEQDALL
jgi:hypothetical protein